MTNLDAVIIQDSIKILIYLFFLIMHLYIKYAFFLTKNEKIF
jgi:hypothetical protein